jgi:hypothetical protein
MPIHILEVPAIASGEKFNGLTASWIEVGWVKVKF